jgi:hypothetical protein
MRRRLNNFPKKNRSKKEVRNNMKRILLVTAIVILMVGISVSPVAATTFTGIPSPSLSPVFGTLVNFDDQPAGTAVLWNDYVSLGVASITETEGLGVFARYGGSQSLPNYVGTGFTGERGGDTDATGWDGTILIELTNPTNKIGIGIANSIGDPETLTIYDANMNQLETSGVPAGANVYAGFERTNSDIKFLKITGDWFAIDDLQFNPSNPNNNIPEFPTVALPIMSVLGIMFLTSRKKHN